MRVIKIGTRGSPLALLQAQMVAGALKFKGYDADIIPVKTTGDKFLSMPLQSIGGKALFAKELQIMLLNKTIDIAVHSLKDLETTHPEGLSLLGVLKREEPNDVLITRKGFLNAYINDGQDFILGTCSPRREAFIRYFYKNAKIVSLRGNVESRLQKILSNELDATILALAGLKRLGLFEKLHEVVDFKVLDVDQFTPASCQGIIGIEGRPDLKDVISSISDETTYKACVIERQKINDFGGTCSSAIGVHATILENSAEVLMQYIDKSTHEMIFKKEHMVL
ncbi:MAG: Porphobilinogen deaminase [Holosporales bacterium]